MSIAPSEVASSQSLIFIIRLKRQPRQNRGSGPNEQAGNIAFRDLVATKRAEYLAVSPRDHVNKNRVANEIIAEVRSRGGRFLRRVNEPHEEPRYALADEPSVVEKTKQALRQSKKVKRPAPEAGGGGRGAGGERRKSAKGDKPVRQAVVEPAPLTVPEALKRGGVKYTAERTAAAGKDQQGSGAQSPMDALTSVPASSSPFPAAMQSVGLQGPMVVMPAPQAGPNPAPTDAASAPQIQIQKQQMAAELFNLAPAQSAWDVARQQQHLAAATLQQRAALHQAAHQQQQQQRQAQSAALTSPEAIHAARLAELQRMAHRQQQFEQAQQIQHAQAAAHAAAASEEAARRARQLEQMRMEQIDLLVRRQREARSIDSQAVRLAQMQALAAAHVSASPAPAPARDAAAAGQQQSRPPSAGGQEAASVLRGTAADGGGGGGDLLLQQQTSVQARYAAELEGRHMLNQAALSGEDALRRQVITNLQSAAALGDVGAAAALSDLLPAGGRALTGVGAPLPPAAGIGQTDAASTGSLSYGSDERLLQQLGELRDGSHRSIGSSTLASLMGTRSGNRADSMSLISSKGLGRLDQCLDGTASLGGAMSVGSVASPGQHGGSGYGKGLVAPDTDLMKSGAVQESPLVVAQELRAVTKAGSSGASCRGSVEDRKSSEPSVAASANSDGSSKIDLLLTAHEMREKREGKEASAIIGSRLREDVQPSIAGESSLDENSFAVGRRSLSQYYRSFHRNGGIDHMDCS